jgi:hypothetical protein
VIVSFVDTGGIVDHRYLEVIVSFNDTGGIVDASKAAPSIRYCSDKSILAKQI